MQSLQLKKYLDQHSNGDKPTVAAWIKHGVEFHEVCTDEGVVLGEVLDNPGNLAEA
jgi:hypothetical protein